ncbi:MAG: VanZ family protein [Bacteroidales bacterium]|nr:VanZ family protein [Bacteroidales bacterium]
MKLAHAIKVIPPWITSILVIALIAYISLDPNPMDINRIKLFAGADKIIHFIMYFTLCTVLILDYAKAIMPHHTKFSSEAAFTTFAFALGLTFEILQGTITEERAFDLFDVVANTLGALAGFAVLKVWGMHKFRKLMVPYYTRRRHHRHHHSNN